MTGTDEKWEAAMAALRDLQVTASRLCGEAAQDKARAETIYENAVARAGGLRAAIHALNETKQDARRIPDDDQP
jgi:hypothetical protein